jgi:hypothetical protein
MDTDGKGKEEEGKGKEENLLPFAFSHSVLSVSIRVHLWLHKSEEKNE